MKYVTLTIDGRKIRVEGGAAIIEAAKEAGIIIPTLCHDERLTAYGACRLCSVEIDDGRKQRIVASCIYPAAEGLVVITDSDRVVQIRRTILELLLALSPSGEIQKLADVYGCKSQKFDRELSFCILCGLCVRYCSEIKKNHVLGYIRRGVAKQVVIFPEIALKSCAGCEGECFRLCPTGVLPNKFAVMLPKFGKTFPTFFPVKMWDEDNMKDISKFVQ